MRSRLVAELCSDLGIDASYSRPRVSNDNPSRRRTSFVHEGSALNNETLDNLSPEAHSLDPWFCTERARSCRDSAGGGGSR